MAGLVFGKAKAVSPNDDPVFERDMVAQDAVLAHHGMSVRKEMAARFHSRVKDHVGEQRGARAQRHPRADHDICPDVSAFADLGGGVNHCCGGEFPVRSLAAGKNMPKAREKARYGFLSRSVAAVISWKSGSTITAAAHVVRARPGVARVGHEGNLGWPPPARSSPCL